MTARWTPAVARPHGVANALGFVGAGLLAVRRDAEPLRHRHRHRTPGGGPVTVQVSGVAVGRWGEPALRRRLAAAERADPTHSHQGSTLRPGSPPGVPDHRHELEVDGDVPAAAAALRRWAAHDGIRARIRPSQAPLEVGTTLLVVAPFGPVEMAVPNRIVAVVDEADRFGFVYGTLPGHAEVGEELFLAEALVSGRVRLTVRIHARPATRLGRAVAPLVGVLQRAAARRYLESWAAAMSA